MLQIKFHVLVHKIEMWYVSDIACVVNTCIMLHNMMVSHRIDNDDVESEALYVYDGHLENDEGNTVAAGGLEPEQQHVNRRMAEMELHRQLYEINRGDGHLSYQQKAMIDSLRFQYVQRRSECLYNAEEHHRLKNACMDELVEILEGNRRL